MLSFSHQQSCKNSFWNWGGVFFLLAITSLPFCGAGHDDTWIMLFAGETLGQGQWFLNHNGATQEVSTSVLGALLAGLASHIAPAGHEYVVWKIAAWLPAMFAGVLFFETLRRRLGPVFSWSWLFVLCCIPQWHYWAWGGLESGLFWLLSLSFLLALSQWTQSPTWHSGTVAGLFALILPLTRADALWAPLVLLCSSSWAKPASTRLRIAPGLFAIAATMAFHCLRYWLSGQWLPSPAYAKASLSIESIQQGLNYLYQFHAQSPLHWTLAITIPLSLWGSIRLLRSLGDTKDHPRLFEWASLLILVIDTTTVLVGGDWMSYHRFAIRSLPIKILVLALSADMALKWLTLRSTRPLIRNLACGTFAAVALMGWNADGVVERPGVFRFGSKISQGVPLSPNLIGYMKTSNMPLQHETRTLSPWLDAELPLLVEQARTAGGLPLVVASYQAGYFAREVRQRFNVSEVIFVDLAGLTERRIGSLPGERTALGLSDGTFHWASSLAQGHSALGHFLAECHPDAVYVLKASLSEVGLMKSAGYSISYSKTVPIDGQAHKAFIFTTTATAQASKCAPLMNPDHRT